MSDILDLLNETVNGTNNRGDSNTPKGGDDANIGDGVAGGDDGKLKDDGESPNPAPDAKKPDEVNDDFEQKALEFLKGNEQLQLKVLSEKLGRDISSFDELVQEKVVEKVIEKEPELPDAVKGLVEFMNKTGRTNLNEYLSAIKDWSAEPKESVVAEYLRRTKKMDGDTLKKYMTVEFFPDRDERLADEVTAIDKEKASINFDITYNQAIDFLKKEQEEFYKPVQTSGPDGGKSADLEAKKAFQENMAKAARELSEIKLSDDFSFKVPKDSGLDSMNSLESIVDKFKDESGFQYKKFLQTLYAGMNIDKILSAYAEHVKTNLTEEEFKRFVNKPNVNISGSGDGGGIEAKDILEILDRL